jgi:formylglycine-generating enzyme required for sulfatase activity
VRQGLGLTLSCVIASTASAEPLQTFRDCDVCPEMIELPLGEFLMGAPEGEFRELFLPGASMRTPESPDVPENETPQNLVRVDIRFAIGRNEITFAEWQACVDDGGCQGKMPDNDLPAFGTAETILKSIETIPVDEMPSRDRIADAVTAGNRLIADGGYPVVNVSYLDAVEYVAWLNRRLKTDDYRLPTEAEWEFAARSGTTTRYAQGQDLLASQANVSGTATHMVLGEEQPQLKTLGFPVPVNEMDAANAWGIRHMSGNVSELTSSCYDRSKPALPRFATTSVWLQNVANSCVRVARGGDYGRSIERARVAARSWWQETDAYPLYGFRLVKELD